MIEIATPTAVLDVRIDELHPAPDNPRSDLGNLDELVASIHAVGIVEPLVVEPVADSYVVVAGHRRLAAAIAAGRVSVPCVIRSFPDDAERLEVMLVENLIRQDLSPLDEARGFARLVELGHSQRRIAERVGCNQSHVSRRLALLELDDDAREEMQRGDVTVREAEQKARPPKPKPAPEPRPEPVAAEQETAPERDEPEVQLPESGAMGDVDKVERHRHPDGYIHDEGGEWCQQDQNILDAWSRHGIPDNHSSREVACQMLFALYRRFREVERCLDEIQPLADLDATQECERDERLAESPLEDWEYVEPDGPKSTDEQFAAVDAVTTKLMSVDVDVVKSDHPIADPGGRAEAIAKAWVEDHHGRAPGTPWVAYRDTKLEVALRRIGKLTEPKTRALIAFEWQPNAWIEGLRRPEVLAAAIARLDELVAGA